MTSLSKAAQEAVLGPESLAPSVLLHWVFETGGMRKVLSLGDFA